MEATVARRYGSIADFNAKNEGHWTKRYVFVLNHQMSNPSLDKAHFPNSYVLQLEDQIFDKNYINPDTKKVTPKTRVIRVVKGERSIYKDEQSEDGQTARHEFKTFSKRGDLIVEAREEQTLEWLMRSNKNGSNPDRDKAVQPLFYLFNPGEGLAEEVSNYKAEAEALNWCYSDSTQFKHIVRYARVLGVNVNEDADLIKHQMAQLAKKNPQKFLDGLKNKYTIRKFYILEAVEKKILTVDLRSNTISWANGHIICNAPIGRSPIDQLVDLSVTDNTFEATFRTIQEQVEPTAVAHPEPKSTVTEMKEAAPAPTPVAKTSSSPDTDMVALVERAIKKGVIEATPTRTWFTFLGKKYQGKKIYDAIKNDATLKESIIKNCDEIHDGN